MINNLHQAKNFIKQCFAIALVFAYVLGAIEFQGIHAAFHSETHSKQVEENPCHRSVYHRDINACKHSFHLTEQKQCLLCHLVSHSDELSVETVTTQKVSPVVTTSVLTTLNYTPFITLPFHGRGPPILPQIA